MPLGFVAEGGVAAENRPPESGVQVGVCQGRSAAVSGAGESNRPGAANPVSGGWVDSTGEFVWVAGGETGGCTAARGSKDDSRFPFRLG
jgi:hypothetical protein